LAAFVATGGGVASAAPLVVDFKQCANHDSPNPAWNLPLNQLHPEADQLRYVEGMSSLLQIIFMNIPFDQP
jgi:hypothetical protein